MAILTILGKNKIKAKTCQSLGTYSFELHGHCPINVFFFPKQEVQTIQTNQSKMLDLSSFTCNV